jgi:hypothetical protein
VACGGASADDFAGLYKGSGSTQYTSPDGRTFRDDHPTWQESLSASVNSDKILFAGLCRVTAVVTGDDTFEMDPILCDLGSDEDCHYTDRITSGDGKLLEDGTQLTLTWNGEYTQRDCVDPANNAVFKYRSSVTLKRQ